MYAAAVFDRNAELVEAGIAPINLTSIMLGTSLSSQYLALTHSLTAKGNGGTDWIGTLLSLYDLQCGDYGFPTVTSISYVSSTAHALSPPFIGTISTGNAFE